MTSHQEPVVRVVNLCKSYDGKHVLEKTSISIDSSDFYVLMGPNGSGKSTLLSIIAGTNSFESGTVEVLGEDIRQQGLQSRNYIGYVPQESFCSGILTGRENLQYFAELLGLSKNEQMRRISELLEMTGLKEEADRRVAEYSGGMRKKLEVATALLKDVRILLLDEPLTGLDPRVRKDYLSMLSKVNKLGTAILLVTHIGEDAEIASCVGFMVHGKIIAEETPDVLKDMSGLKSSIIVDASPQNEKLVAILASISGEGSVSQYDDMTSLISDNPAEMIPRIAERLHRAGFDLRSVETRPPSLEEVFYKLTDYPVRGDVH